MLLLLVVLLFLVAVFGVCGVVTGVDGAAVAVVCFTGFCRPSPDRRRAESALSADNIPGEAPLLEQEASSNQILTLNDRCRRKRLQQYHRKEGVPSGKHFQLNPRVRASKNRDSSLQAVLLSSTLRSLRFLCACGDRLLAAVGRKLVG